MRNFIFDMHAQLMKSFQMTPGSMTLWPWPLYRFGLCCHWVILVSQTNLDEACRKFYDEMQPQVKVKVIYFLRLYIKIWQCEFNHDATIEFKDQKTLKIDLAYTDALISCTLLSCKNQQWFQIASRLVTSVTFIIYLHVKNSVLGGFVATSAFVIINTSGSCFEYFFPKFVKKKDLKRKIWTGIIV